MRNFLLGLITATSICSICGCSNIGGSPEGASSSEMKATFDKLSVDDRAKMLIQAPGPLDDAKKNKIKALYEKEGKTMSPEVERMMSGSGTGH